MRAGDGVRGYPWTICYIVLVLSVLLVLQTLEALGMIR